MRRRRLLAATGGDGRQVQYQMLSNGAEDLVVLPSAASGPSYLLSAVMPAGVSAKQVDDGEVDFVDSSSQAVASYVGRVAVDQVALASDDDVAPAGTSTPVSVRLLSQAGQVATLQVSIDVAWLDSPDRVFPVEVDPTYETVGYDPGYGDIYLNSDNPTLTYPTGGVVGDVDAVAVYRQPRCR